MSAVAIAAPRVRPTTIAVADHVSAWAPEMNAAVVLFDALPVADQRRMANMYSEQFAALRPQFGLAPRATKLTTLFDPAKGKDTATNTKIGKNVLPTLSLTLQSAKAARISVGDGTIVLNTCPNAGLCAALCVLSHGRGKWAIVKAARDWRTFALWSDPVGFAIVLRWEILQASRRHGAFLARLNVNSDLPWEQVGALFDGVDMKAYDYTKRIDAVLGYKGWGTDGWVLPNYRLIYSVNEKTIDQVAERILKAGGSVAVVTDRRKGESTFDFARFGRYDWPIEDGDISDDRYGSPRSTLIDLYAKGAARGRKTRFVRRWYHAAA